MKCTKIIKIINIVMIFISIAGIVGTFEKLGSWPLSVAYIVMLIIGVSLFHFEKEISKGKKE